MSGYRAHIWLESPDNQPWLKPALGSVVAVLIAMAAAVNDPGTAIAAMNTITRVLEGCCAASAVLQSRTVNGLATQYQFVKAL